MPLKWAKRWACSLETTEETDVKNLVVVTRQNMLDITKKITNVTLNTMFMISIFVLWNLPAPLMKIWTTCLRFPGYPTAPLKYPSNLLFFPITIFIIARKRFGILEVQEFTQLNFFNITLCKLLSQWKKFAILRHFLLFQNSRIPPNLALFHMQTQNFQWYHQCNQQ